MLPCLIHMTHTYSAFAFHLTFSPRYTMTSTVKNTKCYLWGTSGAYVCVLLLGLICSATLHTQALLLA